VSLFSKAFWAQTLELVVAAFASTFGASLYLTTTPTLNGLASAAIAGGIAALYSLSKQLGAVQAVNSLVGRAKHSAPNP
jgi:hypothetical protein